MVTTPRRRLSPVYVILRILCLPVLLACSGLVGPSSSRADTDATSSLLWATVSQAVARVDAGQQDALTTILLQNDPLAMAIDDMRQRAWIYTVEGLAAFDFTGEKIHEQHLSLPRGEAVMLQVDPGDGMVWLASNQRVLGLNANGELAFEHRLAAPARGATLDSVRGWLWVGQRDTLVAIDRNGTPADAVDLAGRGQLQALQFDAVTGRLLFVAGDRLYSAQGFDEPSLLLGDRRLRHVVHLAVDGLGQVWLADDHNLLRVDADERIELHLRPLQYYSPEAIVALGTDGRSGGVWIAGRRDLVHIDSNGAVTAAFTPELDSKRTRNILGLAVEPREAAPGLKILNPAAGAFINTPLPRFYLQVEGADIDEESFVFTVNGEAVGSHCEPSGQDVTCLLESALQDGLQKVAVTVADSQGRRSRATEIEFTIDTLAPVLAVVSPQDNSFTNHGTLLIQGHSDEVVTIAVDGIAVAQREDLSFEYGPVTLTEGRTTFALAAVDRAGNRAEASLSVTLDTVPPIPPASQLISIALLDEGLVRIAGSPGSVEAYTIVTVVNQRSGEVGTVQANGDGSFSLTVPAEVGDELHVTTADTAGNISSGINLPVTADPEAQPIRLSIVAPLTGATVSGNFVLVTLRLEGPENTGVLVNGQVATQLPAGEGIYDAYAWVPLEDSSVTLTAMAVAPDGRSQSQEITVQRLEPARYEIAVSHFSGLAPMEVSFQVRDFRGLGIRQISLDADGDGIAEQTSADAQVTFAHTYNETSGLRMAKLDIVDSAGNVHQEVVPIVILDADHLDTLLRAVWSGLKDALLEGNLELALNFMAASSRGTYGAVFDALLPHMSDVLDDFSDIYRLDLSDATGAYLLMTVLDGTARVFVVQFLRGNDGVWRIDSL